MEVKSMTSRSSLRFAIGMLAASVMTLVSIAAGNEPETVLFRAVIGGTIIGWGFSLLATACAWLLTVDDED